MVMPAPLSVHTALRALCDAFAAAGIDDAAFDAAQLLRTVTGVDARACPDKLLTAQQQAQLAALAQRRAAREPLQYLCGTWDFWDFSLFVGPGVLIPRADTEVVCEAAIAALQHRAAATPQRPPTGLDLCSGTGILAIGMARSVPNAKVTAVELSGDAFAYLQRNTQALAPHITCVQADIFAWQKTVSPCSIDVIVSNPPYLSAAEMQALAPELAYEPRMALEAAENGLAFYRQIATTYTPLLCKGGFLVLEIGSTQSDAVCALLTQAHYTNLRVLPDLAGLPRCVVAQA